MPYAPSSAAGSTPSLRSAADAAARRMPGSSGSTPDGRRSQSAYAVTRASARTASSTLG